jgi:hypothetical protein
LNICTLYGTMFGAWQVSQYWLLDEWRCCVFLQVRRVQRVTETRRKFCLWLASGLSHCCTWRDNVCMPRHPLSAGVLGNMGEGCRPLPRITAPHETARQKDTVAQWSQARQHYPAALKFKVNQYEPRPRSKSSQRCDNFKLPRHARGRGKVGYPRQAVWHGKGGHQVGLK